MNELSSVPSALAGGVLIGLAISLLLLVNGRVAGISGVLGGLVTPRADDWTWRALFLAGLVAGGLVTRSVHPEALGAMQATVPTLVVAGLAVGAGTRLARGCTSGHGVCGISRLSVRSIVATVTFMGVAAIVVFLVRHRVAS